MEGLVADYLLHRTGLQAATRTYGRGGVLLDLPTNDPETLAPIPVIGGYATRPKAFLDRRRWPAPDSDDIAFTRIFPAVRSPDGSGNLISSVVAETLQNR